VKYQSRITKRNIVNKVKKLSSISGPSQCRKNALDILLEAAEYCIHAGILVDATGNPAISQNT
jgi:hypothetical protein